MNDNGISIKIAQASKELSPALPLRTMKDDVMHDALKRVTKLLGTFSIILAPLCLVYLFKHLDILNNPHALAGVLRGHLSLGSTTFLLL